MTNSLFYEFYEPLTDGMEMGFLFHEYKHAVTKYELTKDPEIIKHIKRIEHFMQTAKPFPNTEKPSFYYMHSYD